MQFINNFFEKINSKIEDMEKYFSKGQPLEKLYPLYEAGSTFLFTPKDRTTGSVHVRDYIDLKRTMSFVVLALMPVLLWGVYNLGLQTNLVLSKMGVTEIEGVRGTILSLLGFYIDPKCYFSNFMLGFSYFLPIYIVTNVVGGLWEVLFAVVRKHDVNEGMLVTGMLFPLIVPATIPLWQVALAISFAIIFSKEVFGGTGMNFLNPALIARAFLFFAYPSEISGDMVWLPVDGYSSATFLSQLKSGAVSIDVLSFKDSFFGMEYGSFGETSAFCALLGGAFLVITKICQKRIIFGALVGTAVMSLTFNMIGSNTNVMFAVTPLWHYVLGGYAFGIIFMATDPVSAAMTSVGQYIYGAIIGVMVVLVRVVNPAYPEGVMLAIIFGNICAPIIDSLVIEQHIKKRKARIARIGGTI